MFNILLLEHIRNNTTLVEDIKVKDKTKEYKVKWILDIQIVNDQPFYLIKWKGYNTSKNTWEPINNLINCKLLL